jgi:hypothetical protein
VGATTQVSYHYTLSDAAAWASAAETQTAYPQVHADLAGPQTGQVTLVNTNNGWQVSKVPDGSRMPSSVDGKIVE